MTVFEHPGYIIQVYALSCQDALSPLSVRLLPYIEHGS